MQLRPEIFAHAEPAMHRNTGQNQLKIGTIACATNIPDGRNQLERRTNNAGICALDLPAADSAGFFTGAGTLTLGS